MVARLLALVVAVHVVVVVALVLAVLMSSGWPVLISLGLATVATFGWAAVLREMAAEQNYREHATQAAERRKLHVA